MAEGGAMWIVGDWGQASPWSRDTGVKMVKGENNVWIGELYLTRGSKFAIKILKSTVSTTSGGDNTWSAVRYESTLNKSASHDFGEFTDNLIPNGNFEEGRVKWAPAERIASWAEGSFSHPNYLAIGVTQSESSAVSDVFVIPPNQTLQLTGYFHTNGEHAEGAFVMKAISPQQQKLFEVSISLADGGSVGSWNQFSKTFRTADVPMECQIEISNKSAPGTDDWKNFLDFDSLSLVSL